MFVGQFIGQHGMNVVDAEVVGTDEDVSVAVDEYHPDLQLENPENLPIGPVKLGFRPENTILEKEADEGIPGVVELIETFGEEAVVTVEIDRPEPLFAVIDSNRGLSEGANVRAQVEWNAHVFDPDTGDVLSHTKRRQKQPA
jgi:ABC-type sugar transport system ATPase subunit